MYGTADTKQRFDPRFIAAALKNPDGRTLFREICLPGQLALDLICSQFIAFLSPLSEGSVLMASRRVRRLRLLTPMLGGCLEDSPWPLRIADLEEFADRWADVEKQTESGRIVVQRNRELEEGLSLPSSLVFQGRARLPSRELLPKSLRRCLPLQRQACWPRRAGSLSESCTKCCDPRYPRGQSSCFAKPWTFEACCTPDNLTTGWAPAPPDVEEVVGPNAGNLWPELLELKEELKEGCRVHSFGGGDLHPEGSKEERWEELRRWLAAARSLPKSAGGRQRLFPELDLLVSTRACVGPEVEVPWFVLRGQEEDGPASGVELAADAGAVCGPGRLVAGELSSQPGRRVTLPCRQPPADPGLHKLEAYGLELMEGCQLLEGCRQRGGKAPAAAGLPLSCCREGNLQDVEWRGIGLLTGELRTNIAHFARDALWLHLLFGGNTSLAALGAGSDGLDLELALTKHAATECLENDRCVRTGRRVINEMEQFMEEVAIGDITAPPTFHAGDPARLHTVCFEVAAQRWRPWAGDGHAVQSFRTKALKKCRIKDNGMTRKIVLIRRDSLSRQWRDESLVKKHVQALAASIGSSFFAVNLGKLEPCQQVEVLHDAMLILAVHGADLTNMIYLPMGAAVLEVAVECEVEGGSVDTPQWRGPGSLMNSSILQEARAMWKQQDAAGMCPISGATNEEWLQGYPVSQFAKLARQANLLYTAVMDCSGSVCDRQQSADGVFDRGWCTGDTKKRQFVEVDIPNKLIPTLWAIFDGYLRHRT
ncbi:unnamed protein product [Polarella glacialis]|uniref:Glycosyltransferase 61 catalytic domain-containing protein n=1 Tax=Polarella glacialis TaxID=89957 RepID=A0A813D883_POLGL|nr:unnamed protein product [Polarella glacialis]